MIKTLRTTDGSHLKLGRRRPVVTGPRLSFANYLCGAPASLVLPVPPAAWDYTPGAQAALSQMYLNDQLGDCVIAGIAHLEGVFTTLETGKPTIFTPGQITLMYENIGGYKPGDPSSDQGCDEQTALSYWARHGFAYSAHRIFGYLVLDATNKDQVALASYLFGNLFFGLEMPDAWITPAPAGSGFIWDVAGPPNPQNGHCVVSAKASNAQGVNIVTWGMHGTMTWNAVAEYGAHKNGGEVYTVLTKEIIAQAKATAPNGFNWSQLQADFKAIGHGLDRHG